MLSTLIIVFREIIEAGLIVGIVLSATRGVPNRNFWVAGGVAGGITGAVLLAIFASTLGDAIQGTGQEVFNAAILFSAILMLGWHNVWMARHGREIAAEMKSVGNEVALGKRSLAALATVVGVAVLREGAEVVLFLYGVAVSGSNSTNSMILGGAIGILLGCGLSALMYFSLIKIPTRHLFKVTSWLITLLAAGMASQAVFFLQQSGYINIFQQIVWDSSNIISEGSILGKTLHALIGYSEQPSVMQLIAYLLTLATITLMMRVFSKSKT